MQTQYQKDLWARKTGIKAPESKKPPKPLPKRSDKMKAIIRELKKLYPIFLRSHTACAIKSEICTGKATVIHHSKGRGLNEILDQRTWIPSCSACNIHIEKKDKWAREKGFKVSKHKV